MKPDRKFTPMEFKNNKISATERTFPDSPLTYSSRIAPRGHGRRPAPADIALHFRKWCIGAAALALIGCIGLSAVATARADTPAAHPATGEKLEQNQTFTYRMLDEAPTLDPQLNQDSEGFDILRDLFEGLLNQDTEGRLVPGVAERYAASDGNRRFTFNLRKTARWSNGDPVTSQDFVYAWRRAVDPEVGSDYGWYVELAGIRNAGAIQAGNMPVESLGVKAVDPYTLEVDLERPVPYFPAMTTYATFFPAHRPTIERHGIAWTRPENMVSNGAYVLSEHVPNEYHSRTRNPLYWDNANTIIEKVTGLVINDEHQALTRYFADEVDRTGIPAGQYPNLKTQYPDQATSMPSLCTYYFAFNHTDSGHPALRDRRVRTALSYAFDRDIIINNLLKGGQEPAYGFTHPATAGFAPRKPDYAHLDQPERDRIARELISEAGYGPGKPLELTLIYNTSESHKKIATVASQMWKQKLGVDIKLTNFEWKTYLVRRKNQEFDLARAGWCGDYNEASTFLDVLTSSSGANDGRFHNEEMDRLMDESRVLDDPTPNYLQAEAVLAEEMAIIPVYHYTSVFMLKPDIRGWPYDNVQNYWYSKNLYRVKGAR